jgi:hypothetical protein
VAALVAVSGTMLSELGGSAQLLPAGSSRSKEFRHRCVAKLRMCTNGRRDYRCGHGNRPPRLPPVFGQFLPELVAAPCASPFFVVGGAAAFLPFNGDH